MVISCSGIREDLSCFLDGQLGKDRQTQITEHLTTCRQCLQELESLKSLSQLLAGKSSAPVPDIWEELSGKLPSICEVIGEDLSAYLDGELPAAAQEGVKQHLLECAQCNKLFGHLNATNQLLEKGLKLPAAIEINLWPAVKSRLNEDCALIQSELSSFIDQEVDTLRHRAITSHLAGCPGCRSRFDALAQVGDCVRSFYLPAIADDFDLWPAIKKRMQVVPFAAKAGKPKPHQLSRRLYLVGAAAVTVGLCGSLVFLLTVPNNTHGLKPISAEAYLLDSTLNEPAASAEAIVYENQ